MMVEQPCCEKNFKKWWKRYSTNNADMDVLKSSPSKQKIAVKEQKLKNVLYLKKQS